MTKYLIATKRGKVEEVWERVKSLDPGAVRDPEGSPILMWVMTDVDTDVIRGMEEVEDVIKSTDQSGCAQKETWDKWIAEMTQHTKAHGVRMSTDQAEYLYREGYSVAGAMLKLMSRDKKESGTPMLAEEIAAMIMEELADVEEELFKCYTYEEVGILTQDTGFEVHTRDGGVFQVTIKKVR